MRSFRIYCRHNARMIRKIDSLKAHFSQVGANDDVWDRVRDRAREIAKDEPFEFGEAYKVAQLRR